MATNNLIGISGKIGSGKDLIGQLINYIETGGSETYIDLQGFLEFYNDAQLEDGSWLYPYEIRKFADKLKDIVCMLIGCTRAQLEDREFKEKELGEEWNIYHIIGPRYKDRKMIILQSFINYYDAIDFFKRNEIDYGGFKTPINWSGYEEDIPYIETTRLTPRKLLQLLGTDCGRKIIHPNIWVNALFSDYKPSVYYMCDRCGRENIISLLEIPSRFSSMGITDNEFVCPYCKGEEGEGDLTQVITNDFSHWIITDVRFSNEAEAIKQRGGIVIRVNRPCKECGGMGYHKMDCNVGRCEHESEYALDNYEGFNHVIENDGTIEDLLEKIKTII